ncbi:bifunctional phosphoserine phosphatase/homoserine phosphotransferase ThrH [Halorhodospira halochloris]|uniref:phosphoserine phosphatase n=1 Tax=Halorhodospira halochloris TaxID=1052 RepID=A0A120MZR9_HALHR|nr:bifunctional phosphoserine phosphatase/homoserine phosphotransferase ThrH [Halorhodospira halochloris]MBK1651245.1 bifunctional phosphoserine phosphatase/homoserine phosphotransferase ThrH [Halorhodospira halochloris]MCG5530451.1 bifunctional phosphoserine phosphatase/homoserine phosphotransferase ThrH [Halorhodospira halochloris]BAU57521.1 homoserine kinase [Halorhodospira halochloris]
MNIVCLDLEGVLVPEVWVNLADLTGIDAFRATTRDVADYNELMTLRLADMDNHGLGLADIQSVVARLEPLPGARDFLDGLRADYQVIILSDTFYEFARPLMAQLGWPTLFCHSLDVSEQGRINDFNIRLEDHKCETVRALRQLNFRVAAAGDSYNDTRMLGAADCGIFFCPPPEIAEEFPQFTVTHDYVELRRAIDSAFRAE